MTTTINQTTLKELLFYDPLTGNFTRLKKIGGQPVGSIAGHTGKQGYREISICNKKYKSHRLAFLYMTGEFPSDLLDHIDGNKLNNVWTNLRDCSKKQNGYNASLSMGNTSGKKGVTFNKDCQKWQVQVSIEGKQTYLGLFDDLELAASIAIEARNKNHGIYVRHS